MSALDGLVLDQRAAWEHSHSLFAGVLDRLAQIPAEKPALGASGLILDGRDKPVTTAATITCPHCGDQQVVEMPQNACQIHYTCPRCSTVLRPLPGDWCVFCSYAHQRCPPEQVARQTDL
jgi:hypothetical protein